MIKKQQKPLLTIILAIKYITIIKMESKRNDETPFLNKKVRNFIDWSHIYRIQVSDN